MAALAGVRHDTPTIREVALAAIAGRRTPNPCPPDEREAPMPVDDLRISRYLSLVLRHSPEKADVVLSPDGWGSIDALLLGAASHGMQFTRDDLDRVVRQNDKQRFELDETGSRIRAVQGHSVNVDLGLQPTVPPAVLFHGTHEGSVDAIRREGLRPMRRQHVHLSAAAETAERVGARRGKAVVLAVHAGQMHAEGSSFVRAVNGVWLCGAVRPRYILFPRR